MICPKCKTKVSQEDTTCPNCNLKLVFKCPRCDSPSRLGATSCKKCGYTFVKFCPECHSANYATSSICRKCGYEFKNAEDIEQTSENSSIQDTFPVSKPIAEKTVIAQENENTEPEKENKHKQKPNLLIYIDFTNIEDIFEKYNTDEFKQKVSQSIKTTVKIAFGAECEFISDRLVKFSFCHKKSVKILDKINKFEDECFKFNRVLEKTLNCGISYKFVIFSYDEAKKSINSPCLKLGSDKDVIVSSDAYVILNSELSLIKIAPNAYKMIFLDTKPVFEQSQDVKYAQASQIILENLADSKSTIRAISVCAPRGTGKTHLLNDLYYKINRMKTSNTVIFYATCSALTQVSPYGLIQSFFISLFNCPVILNEEFNIKTFEKMVLDKLNLEYIDESSLETLANLIYPIKKDYFENILINKEITYRYLSDVFNYIKQHKNIVFMIDDFDLIDESSFGFLKHLVDKNYFEHNAKMILGYKNSHSIAMYFQSSKLTNANCMNISLRTMNVAECKDFTKNMLGKDFEVPDEILSQIAYNAQGNIAYIEQILQYLYERKILYINDKIVKFKQENTDIELPKTLEECFYSRLDFLKEQNEREYIFLMSASLLGDRFDYNILSNIYNLDENGFFDIIKSLEKKGYAKRKVGDAYGFKNSLTWSYCYIRAKEEELIKLDAKKMLVELNNKVTSTPLVCPILAQITDNKELAYSLWTKNLQYANYIGDVNIYAMAQKQSLILLESVHLDNLDYVKNNICERLGKLIYIKNPAEAKDYLTNALVAAQNCNDINKIVDVSGYLIKSLYLTQDYTDIIEIVDNVLKYFDVRDRSEKRSTTELQIALIKSRKLEAMLRLGLWEAISNIVNLEINPVLKDRLKLFSSHKWINESEIFYTWIEANIILAQSYCEQGSPVAFELISDIDRVLSREKGPKADSLEVRLAFVSAIANTSRGYFTESNNILQEIIKDYNYVIDNPELVCRWNIINLINKILLLDLDTVKDDLFEAAAYADNSGDELSKNIFKTLLAYVYLEEKAYLKAIEIATSEMQYFSSKKTAFGALLAWYISAAATANNKADMYCIEICEKAVKICENAQNNNFYFKILFQELLAKSYLKLNDKENAQMYCDLALQSATVNELLYLQVRLNSLKADIARDKLPSQPDNKKVEFARNTIRMYNRTVEMAKLLNLENMTKKIEKDLTSFKAYCQLNRIIEDKQ